VLSYDTIANAIRSAVDDLPSAVLRRSGSIFYSGKEAFVGRKPLYVLGLNPGGIPRRGTDRDHRGFNRPV
jgi:hypothetical protein